MLFLNEKLDLGLKEMEKALKDNGLSPDPKSWEPGDIEAIERILGRTQREKLEKLG